MLMIHFNQYEEEQMYDIHYYLFSFLEFTHEHQGLKKT